MAAVEARLLAWERRAGDTDSLLGSMKCELEGIAGLGDLTRTLDTTLAAHISDTSTRLAGIDAANASLSAEMHKLIQDSRSPATPGLAAGAEAEAAATATDGASPPETNASELHVLVVSLQAQVASLADQVAALAGGSGKAAPELGHSSLEPVALLVQRDQELRAFTESRVQAVQQELQQAVDTQVARVTSAMQDMRATTAGLQKQIETLEEDLVMLQEQRIEEARAQLEMAVTAVKEDVAALKLQQQAGGSASSAKAGAVATSSTQEVQDVTALLQQQADELKELGQALQQVRQDMAAGQALSSSVQELQERVEAVEKSGSGNSPVLVAADESEVQQEPDWRAAVAALTADVEKLQQKLSGAPQSGVSSGAASPGWQEAFSSLEAEVRALQGSLKQGDELPSLGASDASGAESQSSAGQTRDPSVATADLDAVRDQVSKLEALVATYPDALSSRLSAQSDTLTANLQAVEKELTQHITGLLTSAEESAAMLADSQQRLGALESSTAQALKEMEEVHAGVKFLTQSGAANGLDRQSPKSQQDAAAALSTLTTRMEALEADSKTVADTAQRITEMEAALQELRIAHASSSPLDSQADSLAAQVSSLTDDVQRCLAQAAQAAADTNALDASARAISEHLQARLAALETAAEGGGGGGNAEHSNPISGLGSRLVTLETALKDQATKHATDMELVAPLAQRLAALESLVAEVQRVAHTTEQHGGTAVASDPAGHARHSSERVDTGAGSHASKRELDALRIKVQQLQTGLEEVHSQMKKSAAAAAADAHDASDGLADAPRASPALRPTTAAVAGGGSTTVAGAGGPVGAQIAALTSGQALQQGAIAQLATKLAVLERTVALGGGGGGGGGGGMAVEAMQQATSQQLSLLQGALVQLNGEVNALKLAVPQLMSSIKTASGAEVSGAAALTQAVATGQYGPVLGALAEEIQRAGVRSHNLEQDVRLSLTA
jgi:hypothetical protein